MDKICVITYDEPPHVEYGYVAGREIVYAGAISTRRRLRRFISRHQISRAVIAGDAPGFVRGELEKAGIALCTGEKLMQAVYPGLISRAAKLSKDCDSCTVYASAADGQTLEIIKCAASFFRYVSLSTDSDADHLAEEVLDSMGLALKIGDAGGVGIVCSGKGGRHQLKVDLTGRSTTTFCDENRSIITPSVAEALAGDDLDGNVLERLKLKIYSLC